MGLCHSSGRVHPRLCPKGGSPTGWSCHVAARVPAAGAGSLARGLRRVALAQAAYPARLTIFPGLAATWSSLLRDGEAPGKPAIVPVSSPAHRGSCLRDAGADRPPPWRPPAACLVGFKKMIYIQARSVWPRSFVHGHAWVPPPPARGTLPRPPTFQYAPPSQSPPRILATRWPHRFRKPPHEEPDVPSSC